MYVYVSIDCREKRLLSQRREVSEWLHCSICLPAMSVAYSLKKVRVLHLFVSTGEPGRPCVWKMDPAVHEVIDHHIGQTVTIVT